jgi:hypothetical protein
MLQLHQLEVDGTAAGPLKRRLASLRSTRPRLDWRSYSTIWGWTNHELHCQPSNQEPATMTDELRNLIISCSSWSALLAVLRSGGKHETKRTGTQPVFGQSGDEL